MMGLQKLGLGQFLVKIGLRLLELGLEKFGLGQVGRLGQLVTKETTLVLLLI